MPPAFILSQDQTLHCKKFDRPFSGRFVLVLLTQYQGASRFDSGNLTLCRGHLMTSRICIALFNFQGASPFSGQQDITLHHFFSFANRLAAFFGKIAKKNAALKARCTEQVLEHSPCVLSARRVDAHTAVPAALKRSAQNRLKSKAHAV